MIEMLSEWAARRSRLKRDRKFGRDIEAYCADVLGPLGLAPGKWEEVVHRKNRRVYLGEDKVWKFFRWTQKGYARNFIATAKILEREAIPAPDLYHTDTSAQTRDGYRLCSLVMEKLAGGELTKEMLPEVVEPLARLLARLHSIRSDQWGESYRLRRDGYCAAYFQTEVADMLESIAPWISERGEEPLPDLVGWFGERLAATRPPDGKFSLVSADAHLHNFFRKPNGELCVIDLDRVRFLDFPLDLIYFLFENYDRPMREGVRADPTVSAKEMMDAVEREAAQFLNPYFDAAGTESSDHWKSIRRIFYLRNLIRDLWNLLKARGPKYQTFRQRDLDEIGHESDYKLRCIRIFAKT